MFTFIFVNVFVDIQDRPSRDRPSVECVYFILYREQYRVTTQNINWYKMFSLSIESKSKGTLRA
jgi:hypothetical protein